VLAWYPAYRWHEHYLGLLKEQGNLRGNGKGKGQKLEWGKSEILMFLSGADGAVVALIIPDNGKGAKGFT
jgi:hypothetical protein